jgi:hypothetical protein
MKKRCVAAIRREANRRTAIDETVTPPRNDQAVA